MALEPTGKRVHMLCESCDPQWGPIDGVWHTTFCPIMDYAMSCEFPIVWINPNPAMDKLDELRNDDEWYS